uniref:Uncharacterized protein n=1 Tax=Anguilla anguilla TaxID=7936 RepID=A0A0E9W9B3_ANGAN
MPVSLETKARSVLDFPFFFGFPPSIRSFRKLRVNSWRERKRTGRSVMAWREKEG